MKRIATMFCLGLVLMAFGSYFRKSSAVPASNFSVHAEGVADIEAARQRAKGRLPEFWAAREARVFGTQNFMLKVAIPMEGGGTEHIWVSDVDAHGGGSFTGRFANNPKFIKGRRLGDKVSFDEAQIFDWMFTRHGKIVGNETARPLIARMPKQEAQAFLSKFEKP